MRDILPDLGRWHEDGKSVALGTVIETWGSAPRGAGSRMAFTTDGAITGSVSGGCVEAAVIEAGVRAMQSNRPRLLHFSVADETAWQVGLTCGGSLDVFVNPLDAGFFAELQAALSEPDTAVLITVVRGPAEILGRELLLRENGQTAGTVGSEWDAPALKLARERLVDGVSSRYILGQDVEVFLEVLLPPPALVLVGGVHIAVALVPMAKALGYFTILIDPRRAWADSRRFAQVDRLIQAWPEEAFQHIALTRSAAVVTLTHDPKVDDPALGIALRSPAFYVGALGSRVSQAKRHKRLLDAGLKEAELSRLRAPIGLRIGAETPQEIALAIMAEIVATYRGQAPAETGARAANSTFARSAVTGTN
jgi:xanthine dehydrogenase accessory factor